MFLKELGSWLISSSVGKATLGLCVLVFFCVFAGCCCQHIECNGCRPKKREQVRASFALWLPHPLMLSPPPPFCDLRNLFGCVF